MIIDGLPTLSAPQGTDEIPVERGTTTYKAPLNNLAAAIGAFNLDLGAEIPSNADLNNYTAIGIYYCSSSIVAASLLNAPATGAGFKLIVMYAGTTAQLRQIIIVSGNDGIYERWRNSSNAWGAWRRLIHTGDLPLSVANGGTGAASASAALANLGLDKFKYKTEVVSTGTTFTFSLGSNSRGVLFLTGNTASVNGAYLFSVSSSGTFTITPILAASGLTVSGSSGTLSVPNSSGWTTYVQLFYWNS